MPDPSPDHGRPAIIDGSGPAHDRVYRALRARLLHGELLPGAPLTLRGIASCYGVSMTPAREAVRRLAAEGALSVSPSGRIATPSLTPERVEELASLRALLEVELATRALPRAHPALIERLQSINDRQAAVVGTRDSGQYVRLNLEFHRALYLRAQSPAILAMTETVWLQLGPTLRAMYVRRGRTEPPRYHRLIISALRAGDEPGLRLAVRSDVTHGLHMLAR